MILVRRLALFVALPIASALSPILVLPVLTATLGAGAWAAIAVGQSVGAFGAMVLTFSWNVVGPNVAASSPPDTRRQLYADSVASRCLSGLIALPLAWILAFTFSPADSFTSALMAVAVTLGGALPTWFYVGTGEPLKIFAFDAAPRLVAAAVAIVGIPLIRASWVFPGCLLACTALAAVSSAFAIARSHIRLPNRHDLGHFREHALLVSSGLVSSGYTTSAVALVALVSPASVASFAAAQRIQGFVLTAIAAITNAQQGWVSAFDADEAARRARRRTAFVVNVVVGAGAGLAVSLLLGLVADRLFSGTVDLSPTTAILVGASVFVLAVNLSATFHVLIPAGRRRDLAVIGVVSTAFGVPALLLLASAAGVEGALLAVLIAECVSCCAQLVLIRAGRVGRAGAGEGGSAARSSASNGPRTASAPAPAPAVVVRAER